MNRLSYRYFTVVLACIVLFTTACSYNGGQANREEPNGMQQQTNFEPRMLNDANGTTATVKISEYEGKPYVYLDELVNVLEFNSIWDQAVQTLAMGDNDVVYRFHMNSLQAEIDEDPVVLAEAPIMRDGHILISLDDIELFREYMNFDRNNNGITIYPSDNDVNETTNQDEDFADDPSDPAGGTDSFDGEALDIEDTSAEVSEVWAPNDVNTIPVFTRKQVNANKLIATGMKYLGVKYRFGAGKYARTKRFDCSSFVQQLYNTYGVRLPRTARKQAKYGISVSRKNLRKGDLLYFYVPGRFKTNKTVGHVGVYIGNNKMLHSSPAPKNGVQITNINKSYWKKTYLGAKRVIR